MGGDPIRHRNRPPSHPGARNQHPRFTLVLHSTNILPILRTASTAQNLGDLRMAHPAAEYLRCSPISKTTISTSPSKLKYMFDVSLNCKCRAIYGIGCQSGLSTLLRCCSS